jgi:hypothetical protein
VRKVARGERRERTLELHRYHLDRHLLPELGPRLIRHITTADVADLLDRLRDQGRSEKTIAGALANARKRDALRGPQRLDRGQPGPAGSRPTSAHVRLAARSGSSGAK